MHSEAHGIRIPYGETYEQYKYRWNNRREALRAKNKAYLASKYRAVSSSDD